MATLTSQLILSLVDRVTAPVRAVEKSISSLQQKIAKNNQRLSELRGQMVEAAAVGVGLYKALQAPITAASAFETRMLDIGQKADLSDTAVANLSKRIRTLARDLGVSAITWLSSKPSLATLRAMKGLCTACDRALHIAENVMRKGVERLAKLIRLSRGNAVLSHIGEQREHAAPPARTGGLMLDKTSMDATSTDEVNGAELLSFIERAESKHADRKDIADDISEIFAEAKGRGYSVKIIKEIIKKRAMDPAQRTEDEILKDLYEAALARART